MIQSDAQADRSFRFGVLEIDEARREVRRAGALVTIEPKPFELLIYLIRERDRVVRREELMQRLWPGIVVSDATLSSAVRRAREALGPERERLQGLRKVGYRFIGELGITTPLTLAGRPDIEAAAMESSVEPTTAPFVGRRAEIVQLSEALALGIGGRGRFIAIAGEPGVGKSHLIAELTGRARSLGAEVLAGRCYEGEGGQAFWPWVQIFRSFAAHRDEQQLRSVVATEVTEIARFTAAVSTPGDALPLVDPEMQRARMLDSAVAVLRRAAQQVPLFVVLDDLHWADTASLTLLRTLATQISDLPIVVVGAYRDLEVAAEDPLASMLAVLRRETPLLRIAIAGLSRNETGELLQSLAGGAVEAGVVDAIFDATEGNPFFVHEYWQDLSESGSLIEEADAWRWRTDAPRLSVPATVVDVIQRRLQRLSRVSTQLLAVAAVIGREFGHDVISLVATSPADDVLDALDQAAAFGVIDEDDTRVGHYRFAHALVRETLYEGMTGLRRAVLHRAVGDALEKLLPGAPSPQQVAALAHHFLVAAGTGSADKAIEYAKRAAAEATRACAYDAAVRYLEQAVRMADSRPGAQVGSIDQMRRCELLLQLAEALGRSGAGERIRSTYDAAAALARAIPAPAFLARAAIGMTCSWVPDDEPAVRLLEEALSVLPSGELVLRAQTKARLAKTLYFFPATRARCEQLCREAHELATTSGDPHVLTEVLADSLEALFYSDSLREQDDLAAALRAAAAAAGDARLLLLAGAWQIVNSMRHGRLNDVDHQLREFSRLAGDLRQPRFLHQAAAFEAALLLARGDLVHAETKIEAGLALGARIGDALAPWTHWSQLHHVRREQGRFEEFLAGGLQLRLPPNTPAAQSYERLFRWAAPHVFSELGREDEAKASFDVLLAGGLDDLPAENARNTRIPALFSLADTCATIGDKRAAAQISELLQPYADQWHVIGWGTVVFASTHQMLGALHSVQENWDAATDHFEEALRQHEEQRAICAKTRNLYQYARALQRRGRRADLMRAARLIEQGLKVASQHGLAGVAARLRRLKR